MPDSTDRPEPAHPGDDYAEITAMLAPARPASPAPTGERPRCGFVADFESKPWQCERRAGHDGDHRSEPLT